MNISQDAVDMIKIVCVAPLVLALVGFIGIGAQQAHAISESSYRFRYEHATNESPSYRAGVSDANHNGAGPLYIGQPGKGLAFHTPGFNKGYVDGFCSVSGNGTESDADQGTFTCP